MKLKKNGARGDARPQHPLWIRHCFDSEDFVVVERSKEEATISSRRQEGVRGQTTSCGQGQ